MKHLRVKPYLDEAPTWPDRGTVILAQYDAETVVVYQAYRRSIGQAAAQTQSLQVNGFSFERMSWIKPSFLWMMHRSNWATDRGQEVVLAIWIQRAAFDSILEAAVPSSFDEQVYPSREAWQIAHDESDVRLQFDPDYPPHGPKLKRRAIQLGLRGDFLRRFATDWIVQIEDITEFVHQQAEFRRDTDFMLIPAQRVYPVSDAEVARRMGLTKTTSD